MPREDAASWSVFLNTTLTGCRHLVKVDLSCNEALSGKLDPFSELAVLEELDLTICSGMQGSLKPLAKLSKLRVFNRLHSCCTLAGNTLIIQAYGVL